MGEWTCKARPHTLTLGAISMRHFCIILFLTTLLIACNDKSNPDVGRTSDNVDSTKSLFVDNGVAEFRILDGENSAYEYQITETNYSQAYLDVDGDLKQYIAKYLTKTKTCTGCDGRERNIEIKLSLFDKPSETVRTINHRCDNIVLDAHTYKTITYGCCGGEDEIEIYDYESKQIIEGDSKIILGNIPNSNINLYIAYKQAQNDSTTLGTLFFSYSASDRYSVKIKSKPLPEEYCSLFTPDMSIQTSDEKDKFSDVSNEYTFWSLNNIRSQNDVNNLTIRITYDCESDANSKPIDIPIINGKPFGKDLRNQEIIYRLE